MKNTEFEQKLEQLGLSKKEFTAIVGMPYQTLMNWKQKEQTPIWVDSWLENYKLAQKYKVIESLIIEKLNELK